MNKVAIYVVVSVLIGIVVGAGIGWYLKPAERVEVPSGLQGEVKIGWIDALSGSGAFWAEELLACGEVAVEEVNDYLNKTGAGWWIKLYVEDSQLKPEVALDKLKSLHAQGIEIVTGIGFSADLKAMMQYANTNHILLLAGGNSYELAVEDDYIFRVLPNSTTSAYCLTALYRYFGIEHVIFVWRGDAYADSLEQATEALCEKYGISFDPAIRYNPEAAEFSGEAATLNSKVQDAIAQYGADKVAWTILCFEEGTAFFDALKPYHPENWGIRLLSTGGLCLMDWVTEPAYAELYTQLNSTASDFRPTVSLRTQKVIEKVKAKIGREPDIYGLIGYDEIWILALALQAAGKYDADAVKAQLPTVFENYASIIGWAPLNKYGDKAAVTFGLYRVMKVDDTYKWARVGTYDLLTDTVNWLSKPEIIS